jgi:hypothetical protein
MSFTEPLDTSCFRLSPPSPGNYGLPDDLQWPMDLSDGSDGSVETDETDWTDGSAGSAETDLPVVPELVELSSNCDHSLPVMCTLPTPLSPYLNMSRVAYGRKKRILLSASHQIDLDKKRPKLDASPSVFRINTTRHLY